MTGEIHGWTIKSDTLQPCDQNRSCRVFSSAFNSSCDLKHPFRRPQKQVNADKARENLIWRLLNLRQNGNPHRI